jgi:acid phosphatase type 7
MLRSVTISSVFADLKNSRYYSVRAANTLILVLDSSLDESSGPQGQWLTQKLETIPADVDFVFIVLHHPPYTSSSDEKKYGGGHSARIAEQTLAKTLETRQQNIRARFVIFAGHMHNYERHEHGGVTYFISRAACRAMVAKRVRHPRDLEVQPSPGCHRKVLAK